MRCSVPSTLVFPVPRRTTVPLQCLCGNPIRDGDWVRCASCQLRLQMTSRSLLRQEVTRFLEGHTKECDCGRPRALEAHACPRCLWIDGIPSEEPIISMLRHQGSLTMWEIMVSTRIQLKKAGPLMESLLRKNRVLLVRGRYSLTFG